MRLKMLVACMLLVSGSVDAAETVVRMKLRVRDTGFIPEISIANMQDLTPNDSVPAQFKSVVDDLIRTSTFTVYTAGELDVALQKTTSELTARHEQLITIVDQKLQASDEKLRADVIKAINDLPQAVLSQTAVEAIKEAILAQLRDEMQQLRADLESQITELKTAH